MSGGVMVRFSHLPVQHGGASIMWRDCFTASGSVLSKWNNKNGGLPPKFQTSPKSKARELKPGVSCVYQQDNNPKL